MPSFFEYAFALNRVAALSPTVYAVLKRLWDRSQGTPPDQALRKLIEAEAPPAWPAATRGKVLFFSPRYWPIHLSWELVAAYALRAEGYEPVFVGCGAAARLCETYALEMPRGGFCTYCSDSTARLLAPTGFRYQTLGDFIDADRARADARGHVRELTLAQCRSFEHQGIAFGKLVEPSVARSLRQVMFDDDDKTVAFYRSFLETALINHAALTAILQEPWAFAFMLNGKFVAEAVLYHMARARNLDCVVYERGFKRDTLFFAVNDQVTDFDVTAHYREVRETALTEAEEERLRAYESARRVGEQAIIQYFPKLEEDKRAVVAEYGIDTSKPVAVVFPNIVWDTAVFGHERAFASIWQWIRTTIEAFVAMPDWELIVRVHPAEVRLPARTRESMLTLIEKHFPNLPRHIHVVPPTAPASSYVFLDMASRVLVYSSTMGLEAAMTGKEVVTTARTHYAEQGFTKDARDGAEYRALVSASAQPVCERGRALARRYANLFFYRFHIPVKSLTEPRLSLPQYRFTSLRDLLSGDYPEVRFVRHGLLPLAAGCRVLAAEAATPSAEPSP